MIRCRWPGARRALATLTAAAFAAPFVSPAPAAATLVADTAAVGAQSTAPATYAGRPLGEALRLLQAQGVKVVFSTELVHPDMRVAGEPRATTPRRILDEILQPHGLRAKNGPRDTLLVVRAEERKKPEPRRLPVAAVAPPKLPPAMSDGQVNGAGTYTEQVAVSGESGAASTRRLAPAPQSLGRAEIEAQRSVLADDPIRTVQALPGVAAADDFHADFSVRGSDLGHIGMSIDGVMTPFLLHTVQRGDASGSVALLNADVVDRMSLASGTYSSRYGNRTGAWLETNLREGTRNGRRFRGLISGSGASGIGEGPLGSRGSWLAAVRGNELSWLMRMLDEEARTKGDFGFGDFQSKAVFDLGQSHQLQGALVVGQAWVGEILPEDADGDSPPVAPMPGSTEMGMLVTNALQSTFGSSLFLSQRVSLVVQRSAFVEHEEETETAAFLEPAYRADLTWGARRGMLVDAGLSFQRPRERSSAPRDPLTVPLFTAGLPGGVSTAYERAALLASGYAQVSWQDPRGWSITPGVRLVQSSLVEEGAVLPSLQAAWSRGDDGLVVRGGLGWYRQVPEIEAVAGPFGADDLRSERARHIDLTIEHPLPKAFRGAITFYDREERDHLRLQGAEFVAIDGRLASQPSSSAAHPSSGTGVAGASWLRFPDERPRYANVLQGRSRGVEVLVRRDGVSGLTGWASYAYGRTVQTDASTRETFWGDFDQRHTLNAYGHYRFTSKLSVSAKFRYGSNYPITGYVVPTDDGYAVGERRNETRLPAYARLDLRGNRAFTVKNRRMTLYVEVLNVLGRKNLGARVGRVDGATGRVTGATTPLFPVVPFGGLLIEF